MSGKVDGIKKIGIFDVGEPCLISWGLQYNKKTTLTLSKRGFFSFYCLQARELVFSLPFDIHYNIGTSSVSDCLPVSSHIHSELSGHLVPGPSNYRHTEPSVLQGLQLLDVDMRPHQPPLWPCKLKIYMYAVLFLFLWRTLIPSACWFNILQLILT